MRAKEDESILLGLACRYHTYKVRCQIKTKEQRANHFKKGWHLWEAQLMQLRWAEGECE